MGVGWRRAFCTSIRGDPENPVMSPTTGEKQPQQHRSPSPSPRSCAKLSFFSGGGGGSRGSSNPSTPRLRGTVAANPRCRTKSMSLDSPRLQCDDTTPGIITPTSSTTTTPTAAAAATAAATTTNTPRRSPIPFQRRAFSNPSSPRSPSGFSLFRNFSRSRCRICSRSLKGSQETPVFTAECSHAFHFPCIAAYVQSHGSLACPVCSNAWQQAPFLLSALHHRPPQTGQDIVIEQQRLAGGTENRNPNRRAASGRMSNKGRERELGGNRATAPPPPPAAAAGPKIYDDDEPLLLVSQSGCGGGGGGGMRFNPIPEVADEDNDEDVQGEEENEEYERDDEVLGFLRAPPGAAGDQPPRPTSKAKFGGVVVTVTPPVALVSAGRRHQNYVVAIKVKAPSLRSASDAVGRAPIDLVTVLDVGQGMTGEKLHMLKRSMRLVISSLGPGDRLSMVAFSAAAGAKRLLPLRRMSRQGQRAARQIVERLVVVRNGSVATQGPKGPCLGDALRKATKVLEDRRDRNPVATIMLLSDTGQQQQPRDEAKVKDENDHHHYHPEHLHAPRVKSSHGRPPSHPATTAVAAATRFAHLEIPIDASSMAAPSPAQQQQKQSQLPYEDALAKCVGGLVSVVMQDVRLQFAVSSGEVSAVYFRGDRGVRGEVVSGSGGNSIRLGDLYAEEEKELLVELRLPAAATVGPQDFRLMVKCSYRDPATQELVIGGDQPLLLPPLLHSSRSTASVALRNLFVSTRAVNESRRLAELSDYGTAYHLLSSARSLIQQSAATEQDHHLISSLDEEIAELQERRRQQHREQQEQPPLSSPRGRREAAAAAAAARGGGGGGGVGGGGEPLTPTSAWRAAEQLAKVAIMRKSLNRVSDLHGFENARF